MRPLWKLTVTELKLFLREPAAVFFTLAFPLLLLWLNGGNGNRPRDELGGRGLMDVLAPGFVAMVLAEVGLTSLPGLLSSYRERGILRRLAVTPVSPTRLLAAQLLAHLAAATAGAALVAGVGMALFGLNPPRDPARLLAAYLLGALALLAIGSVVAALAPTPRVAEAAGLPLRWVHPDACAGRAAEHARVVDPAGPIVGLREPWARVLCVPRHHPRPARALQHQPDGRAGAAFVSHGGCRSR